MPQNWLFCNTEFKIVTPYSVSVPYLCAPKFEMKQIVPMERQLYETALIIAAVINLVMAFALVHNNIWYRKFDVYCRSRALSASVFAAFAVGFLFHRYLGWRFGWPEAASTLTITYFHMGAVFFGWSHTSLLRPDYPSRRIVLRDVLLLVVSHSLCWVSMFVIRVPIVRQLAYTVFFVHAAYIASYFYYTYFRVRRSLSGRVSGIKAPRWWSTEAKRQVLSYHHSFVLACHLIILFGFGTIALTAVFPDSVWPHTFLLGCSVAVFGFIFYSLSEYGSVVESATNATEDASASDLSGLGPRI